MLIFLCLSLLQLTDDTRHFFFYFAKAIDKMNEEHAAEKASEGKNADGDTKLSVEFMKLDLGSLKSTVDFIEEFKSSGRHLHCLICNAGIISSDRSALLRLMGSLSAWGLLLDTRVQ